MKLFLTLLFFLLKVASSAAVNDLQFETLDILRLNSTEPQFNKHLELEKYLKSENLVELFVRGLCINGENCGPTYFNLQPVKEELAYNNRTYWSFVVKGLDFGEVPQYFGLKADDKDAVEKMKQNLLKGRIIRWFHFRIEHVVVNGTDYGSFRSMRIYE